MSRIKRSSLAEADIIEHWFYLAVEAQSRVPADHFIGRLEKALDALARHPHIGTPKNHYREGLYQFPTGNYLIFYFPLEKGGIEVVRVLHGSRAIERHF